MARTLEEREQWFKEFSKNLGLGTNPKNASDVLVDHIFVQKEGDPMPAKAFAKNPFAYNSSPRQRQEAIETLMDAYEKNSLLAPDEKGVVRPIVKDGGKDFVRKDMEEPKLEGGSFGRSVKRVINGILPRVFAKDVEKEKQYEKDLKRYKELKELADKNKVTIVAMSQAKKQQDAEEKAELREAELDKDLQALNRNLQNIPGPGLKPNEKKNGLEKWGLGTSKDQPADPDLKDLNPQELEDFQRFTMAHMAANASPEQLQKFLQNPGRRTVGMAMLAEEAKAEYLQMRGEFKANPENAGKDFTMEDPQRTADAVKNLSSVMQKENKLSAMHMTAAKLGQTLMPAYKKQADKIPEGRKPGEYDLKFMEAMEKMSAIYAEGMAAKKTLVGMDSLKQNTQERLDALSKVGAMESVNAIMRDNVKSMKGGLVDKKDGLTKEQKFLTSDMFTKNFMQNKAARSTTIQNLAKDKPEDFHRKFLSMDDQMKMEKFGHTVNSEGSASLLKTMMNKQTAKVNSVKRELAMENPGINNPSIGALER